MREFFHGWRRKAGAVSLVMALEFAASWVRSLIYFEQVWCDVFGTTIWLSHYDGRQHVGLTKTSPPHDRGCQSIPLSEYDTEFNPELYPIWSCGGVGDSSITFPQWAVAIPLTLLSAYLILWKPRKRKGKKTL